MSRPFVAAALLALACGSDRGPAEQSPPARAALSRTSPLPPGEVCPAGGTVVRTGIDDDGDGVLDDAEVTSQAPICNPPERALLQRAEVEPPGPNCAQGGTAIRAGLDRDADGVLDDDEVTRTSHACGEPPAAVLTAVRDEAPGLGCPAGGKRVEAGPDLDRDGALGAGEVESTSFVCTTAAVPEPVLAVLDGGAPPPTCAFGGTWVRAGRDLDRDGVLDPEEGEVRAAVCSRVAFGFRITSQEDAALVNGAAAVIGNLEVVSPTLEDLFLLTTTITGTVFVHDSPRLTSISLSSLRFLGGGLVVQDNPALAHISLPGTYSRWPVLRVGGELVIARNASLTDPGLEGISEVARWVRIEDNDALSRLRLRLGTVGDGFVLRGNAALRDLYSPDHRLPMGTVGGTIEISGSPALEHVTFSQLRAAGGLTLAGNAKLYDVITLLPWGEDTVILGDVSVVDNPSLSFSIGTSTLRLVTGSLRVERNAALRGLGLFADLRWVGGDVTLADNPALRWPYLTALATANTIRIERNGALASIGSDPAIGSFLALRAVRALVVADNAALTSLRLPALDAAGAITVTGNPRLPACMVTALEAQLEPAPWRTVVNGGNDEAAVCP